MTNLTYGSREARIGWWRTTPSLIATVPYQPTTPKDMRSRRLRYKNVLYMHLIPLGDVDDLCPILPSCNMLIGNQSVQIEEKPWIRPLWNLDWEDWENMSISSHG
jgi:hypothetical protein